MLLAVAVPGSPCGIPPNPPVLLSELHEQFRFLLFYFVTEERLPEVPYYSGQNPINGARHVVIILQKDSCPDYDPQLGARGT
jgi:hypothetical protein